MDKDGPALAVLATSRVRETEVKYSVSPAASGQLLLHSRTICLVLPTTARSCYATNLLLFTASNPMCFV